MDTLLPLFQTCVRVGAEFLTPEKWMPNIMLVGFNASVFDDLTLHINDIIKGLGLQEDSVVTCVNSSVRRCSDGKPEPYAIVRCTEQAHLDAVSTALNERLGLGVEKELVQEFVTPDPASIWNQNGR